MVTPYRAVIAMRIVTSIAVAGLLIVTLGPFQGAESRAGLSDKAAHVIALYCIALLAFSTAPRTRRTDLALATIGLGVVIELIQGVTGRSLSLGDLAADGLGVGAALAPTWVEGFRQQARRRPHLPLGQIAKTDRRRRGKRIKAFRSQAMIVCNGSPVVGAATRDGVSSTATEIA